MVYEGEASFVNRPLLRRAEKLASLAQLGLSARREALLI